MSCSEDCTPIKLEIANYYEFPIGKKGRILIQGSGDYQIVVADTTILNVSFQEINQLSILPKNRKGETELVILDLKSRETAKTTVKITDSYFSFLIGNPLQIPFTQNEHLYFIENTLNDLLIFDNDSLLLNKGHYEFGKTEQNYTLRILFDNDLNGYKELDLILENNSDLINQFIEKRIMSGRDSIANYYISKIRSDMPITMNAVEKNTGKKYYFVMTDRIIPYFYLQ